MALQNTLKNMAYDHPAYIVRGVITGVQAAGSGGVSANYVAHADMLVTALVAYPTVAGTSTYTATQYYNNGTNSASLHVNAGQLSLIKVTNTNAGINGTGAQALATTTYGPFVIDRYYSNGTGTGAIGAAARFALNTSTGTAGVGGVSVAAGDRLFVVNGTDATAVHAWTLDYQLQPLADVIA